MADGRFDDLLLGLARQHKTVEELSYSVLSFFERRTDLFHVMETPNAPMGFAPGVAERMFMKHFTFFQARYFERCQPYLLGPEPCEEPAPASSSSAVAPAAASAAGSCEPPDVADASVAPSSGFVGDAAATPSTSSQTPADGDDTSGSALPEATKKKMKHISTWNGAITDKYYWTQSISETTIEVTVPTSSARDLKVDLTATRASIKCKGVVVLEGKLHEKIFCEDSVWHLDDDKVIITMEKQRHTWWKCVFEGDPEIDTTKVESTKRMDEYDGETQGAIRKIMFDQNMKAMGKPTSDQIRTSEIMREAWNAPGSPFRGSEFDPTMLNLSSPVGDDFFAEVEERRIKEARALKEAEKAAAAFDEGRVQASE